MKGRTDDPVLIINPRNKVNLPASPGFIEHGRQILVTAWGNKIEFIVTAAKSVTAANNPSIAGNGSCVNVLMGNKTRRRLIVPGEIRRRRLTRALPGG